MKAVQTLSELRHSNLQVVSNLMAGTAAQSLDDVAPEHPQVNNELRVPGCVVVRCD